MSQNMGKVQYSPRRASSQFTGHYRRHDQSNQSHQLQAAAATRQPWPGVRRPATAVHCHHAGGRSSPLLRHREGRNGAGRLGQGPAPVEQKFEAVP
eukprot:COSAG01_NODE_3907_length_5556_cov_8.827378_10_plen_96_part_00